MTDNQLKAKNYLEQYGEAKLDLAYRAAQLEKARAMAENIKSILGDIEEPISTVPGGRERLLASIADMSISYDVKVMEVEELRARLEQILAINLSGIYRSVLLHRYINEFNFYRIAKITQYSESHVRRIHRRALEKLGQKLK